MKANGVLVISLDFELSWGAWPGEETSQHYKESILGARAAIPLLLKLFNQYKIHSTWAAVGLLFFGSRDDLIKGLPRKKPDYVNNKLSAYNHLDEVGENETEDPYHYAASLLKMIKSFPHQEVGSHTFSHYYCLEKGQNIEAFKSDLEAAVRIAEKYGISLKSIAFPQNQVNNEYTSVCKEKGLYSYRGNPSRWICEKIVLGRSVVTFLRRGLRLIDAYFNIFGHNCYSINEMTCDLLFDIRWSRFLRPYSEKLKYIESLKLQRILSDLTHAAKKGLVYHLWWHPYNFGINLDKNLAFLRRILDHYAVLRDTYGMESLNMGELADRLVEEVNYGR